VHDFEAEMFGANEIVPLVLYNEDPLIFRLPRTSTTVMTRFSDETSGLQQRDQRLVVMLA
jgi:hypothetical protein